MSSFKVLTVLILCCYLPIWILVSGSPLGAHKFPVEAFRSSLMSNATERKDVPDDCILDMFEGSCLNEDCPCADFNWFCCYDLVCDTDNDKCIPTEPEESRSS